MTREREIRSRERQMANGDVGLLEICRGEREKKMMAMLREGRRAGFEVYQMTSRRIE